MAAAGFPTNDLMALSQLVASNAPPVRQVNSTPSTTAIGTMQKSSKVHTLSQKQVKQQQGWKSNNNNDNIWDVDELPEMGTFRHPTFQSSTQSTQQEPEYSVKYRQLVGSEDIYLGLDQHKNPGLIGCDEMVLEVQLPGVHSMQEIELQVTRKFIDLRCGDK